MNYEHLMNNAKLFAYETSKYFKSPERILKYYTCKNEVLVISNLRIFVYFYTTFIDEKDDLLKNVNFNRVSDNVLDLEIKGKRFELVFPEGELKTLENYYNEYLEYK